MRRAVVAHLTQYETEADISIAVQVWEGEECLLYEKVFDAHIARPASRAEHTSDEFAVQSIAAMCRALIVKSGVSPDAPMLDVEKGLSEKL